MGGRGAALLMSQERQFFGAPLRPAKQMCGSIFCVHPSFDRRTPCIWHRVMIRPNSLHAGSSASGKKWSRATVNDVAAISPRKLAWACADFLWKHDATLRSLGLERLSVGAGQATVAMTVLPAMVNGLGITHGGAIFTLADAVFSLACNTYNERTVAAHCSVSFLRPTGLGDRLIATATEVVRTARSGIYDVSVTLEEVIVAEFRAHSRVIGGALLPAETIGPN
jgi:acyl-CoA thioesterase